VGLSGLLFFVMAFAFGTYTVALWLTGAAAEGFSTAIILQLMSTSVTLLCLGVLGEYVGRIYEEVKRRPRYVVSEVTTQQHARLPEFPPFSHCEPGTRRNDPHVKRRAA
jgi:dolichol-phosphate mannosyltransferase